LALYDGITGLAADFRCILSLSVLCHFSGGGSSASVAVFWQQTCGGARPEVGCCAPAPLILFLFLQVIAGHCDCRFFAMVVLVRVRISVSHLNQSCFDPSYYGGSWPCYGYDADPAADAGRVTVTELIQQWITLC